ncbi:hypothetical protein FIBSPDRAFT_943302 [Athelia psychrophila]|uniref:Uncharacterized protein n=1 Tax=Athelia psychrophila TaxID=1759441 RepID=A0A166W8Y1_9AGAM|nr:hypothetical protein FIBSPDRAFT_943302 [Fibularhizoctonia sp. CBS 109695]
MQFFKSTLFIAVAAAASLVAATPSPATEACADYGYKCTYNTDCCSDECIASVCV